ncbi:MAG: class I SAM-dependent methyltransferase, partial [Bacteroidota bacterium]
GKILFPAEGEGRNAVYAAKMGWEVSAFDISVEGKRKAMELADNNQVHLAYQIGELPNLTLKSAPFDVIALIYAHFPPQIKSMYHQILDGYLRLGGLIIFEAFSKSHVAYKQKDARVGGPMDLDMLFSIEEILADFTGYEVIELAEQEVELNEGYGHIGLGSVIRFVGKKKE